MEQIFKKLIDENRPKREILGSKKYFRSAVFIPFIRVDDEEQLLFQRRNPSIRQGNEICFPGGKFDSGLDLSYEDTAVRETSEELGLLAQSIKSKGQLGTLLAPMGALIEVFYGALAVNSLDELVINREEVEEVFCIPLEFFKAKEPKKYAVRLEVQPSYLDSNGSKITLLPSMELGLPPRYQEPWGGRKYPVYVYSTPYGIIWGLTAEIIFELIGRLNDT